MKRLMLLILVVLTVCGLLNANPGYLGVYQTKDWLQFQIYALDTLTGQWRRPDSLYLHIFYGRAPSVPSFTTRSSGADINALAWIDSMKISSMTQPIYTYHDSVGRIDADSGNGNYDGILQAFYQTKTTDFAFSFVIADSSFTKAINTAASDSQTVDKSNLGTLTVALTATGSDADTGIVAMKTREAALRDSVHLRSTVVPATVATIFGADSATYAGTAATMGKAMSATGAAAGGITEAQMRIMVDTGMGVRKITTVVHAVKSNNTFDVDTVSLGFSNGYDLLRAMIFVNRHGSRPSFFRSGINRAVTGGAYDTLTMIDTMTFAAGDSITIYPTPFWDFMPADTAKELFASATWDLDSGQVFAAGTMGRLMILAAIAGADTSAFKAMLINNGYRAAKDSTNKGMATGQNYSLPRLGDQVACSGGSGSCQDSAGVRFVVRVWDATNLAAVPGAPVTIRTSLTGTAYDHRLSTNPSGNAIFTIDPAAYYIFVESPGISFPESAYTITGADSILMSGTGATIVAASDPTKAAVVGQLWKMTSKNGVSSACANCDVVFDLLASNCSDTVQTALFVTKSVKTTANANGYITAYLPLTGHMACEDGSTPLWRMTVTVGNKRTELTFSTPDTSTVDIGGLLK
jgi:hypothetical protein